MASGNKKIGIGIDLGTTNTCVAVWRDGKIETIPNRLGEFLTPSWVAYTDEEVLIGKTAKNNAYRNFDRTFFGIKRIIGRKYNDPVVKEAIINWKFKVVQDELGLPKLEVHHNNETKYIYPEEISGLILREIKEVAEEYLGEERITDAVITVPAYFNDHQRQATKDAAKIAGLHVLRLINEPTAAAIAYIYNKPTKKEHNVLVYDLGGGTLDVSIVSLVENSIIVKATRGDSNLGGGNFDNRCISYMTKLIESKYKVNIADAINLNLLRRLQNQIERAKHELSSSVTSNIELYSVCNGIDVFEDLTRARFDDLNEDLYDRTISIVEQCIKEANLSKQEIDEIVLVGGSTRLPTIQEKLKKFFGRAVSKAINPDQAVAHGAALLAAKLVGDLSLPITIQDVLPMSLGIETLDGKMNILIKRNSQIPMEAQRTYTSGVEGENAIRITILEGDCKVAKKNLRLGFFDLLDLPTNPIVVVTFKVDINGIVKVTAEEISKGIHQTVHVTLNKGRLTSKEIGVLRRHSNLIKEGNKEWALIKIQRNQLECYLLKVKDNLISDKCNTEESQKKNLLNLVEDTLSWMSTKNAFHLKNLETTFRHVSQNCFQVFR